MNAEITPIRIGNIYGSQFGTGYAGNVWDKGSISPTIMTMQGGILEPLIFPTITTRTGDADIDLIVEYETNRDIRTIEE